MTATALAGDAIHACFVTGFGAFALDVALELPGRGVTAVFGPSGSGKTTLLRCIAGLQRAAHGRLSVRGSVWQDERVFLPVHRRPLGYVFQEASLFDHLTVRGNLDYGLKRLPAAQRGSHGEAVALLGIGHLLERMPAGLSGGERQRVAIARALALRPQLLLMDEPLASLDKPRRQEFLPYLERLRDELDIPVLYVSHSVDEVARLADYLVVLADGRVRAAGSLQATLARLDLAGAFADEVGVVIDARIAWHHDGDHLSGLDIAGASLQVVRRPEAIGRSVRLRIRAGDVSLADRRPEGSSILNLLPARVVELAEASPGQVLVRLDLAGAALLARVSSRSCRLLRVEPGRRLWAQIKGVAILG